MFLFVLSICFAQEFQVLLLAEWWMDMWGSVDDAHPAVRHRETTPLIDLRSKNTF